MSVLNVQYLAFQNAGAALSSASSEVNSTGPAVVGDVGHPLLTEAGEAFNKAWDRDGPVLVDALAADGKQSQHTAAEFARVDALLKKQAEGQQ